VSASAHRRSCAAGHFLTARGTLQWTLHLPRRLAKGRYIVFSRATGADGSLEAVKLSGGSNVVRVLVR
jgi:hypothetical protein